MNTNLSIIHTNFHIRDLASKRLIPKLAFLFIKESVVFISDVGKKSILIDPLNEIIMRKSTYYPRNGK